jgi:hypothetical protein
MASLNYWRASEQKRRRRSELSPDLLLRHGQETNYPLSPKPCIRKNESLDLYRIKQRRRRERSCTMLSSGTAPIFRGRLFEAGIDAGGGTFRVNAELESLLN